MRLLLCALLILGLSAPAAALHAPRKGEQGFHPPHMCHLLFSDQRWLKNLRLPICPRLKIEPMIEPVYMES